LLAFLGELDTHTREEEFVPARFRRYVEVLELKMVNRIINENRVFAQNTNLSLKFLK